MGIFDSFFHPEKAYENAEDQTKKYWQQAMGFQQPFANTGMDQIRRLLGAEDSLLDPVTLQNNWANSYKTSPYATNLLNESKNAGLDAASSMGLMGSSTALNNITKSAGNIVSGDQRNFLNDLMQKYMTGIGLGQNMFDTGAGVGENLGNQSLEVGKDMASSAYNRTNAPGNMLMKLLGTAGGLGIDYLTGGFGSGALGRGAFQPDWMNMFSNNNSMNNGSKVGSNPWMGG